MTPSAKGGIAEMAIAAAAVKLGIVVARPLIEGGRYDLIFDTGERLLRVQCKWARMTNGVVEVRGGTCRHSPGKGYIRGTYDEHEIDLIAAYCEELDRIYLIPIEEMAGRHVIHLRIAPAQNNQSLLVNWASDYELGAIAQLGERRHGMAEVEGSSPSGSTQRKPPARAAFVVPEGPRSA
jgi:hypothetical protein